MAKYKVTEHILGYDDKPMAEGDSFVSYRSIFNLALNSFQQEEKPTAEEKTNAFALTLKIFSADEVELSAEERVLIEKRVEKNYNYPLFIGRTKEFLKDK